MATIKLQRQVFRDALQRSQVKPDEVEAIGKLIGDGARTVNVTIDVAQLPNSYLASLLN